MSISSVVWSAKVGRSARKPQHWNITPVGKEHRQTRLQNALRACKCYTEISCLYMER